MADDSQARVIVSGTPGETLARYFVPRDDSLGLRWTLPGFDDGDWTQGATGIGYENSPQDYDRLLRTDLKDEMVGRTSAYVRVPFQLNSLDDIQQLTLRMKYDDGYVAYLNKLDEGRSSAGPTGDTPMDFDATASSQKTVDRRPKSGIDYTDKYAPVVSWSTVRLMLCLSVSQNWKTKQVDFSNAFVQAKLDKDVFIGLPPMFSGPNAEDRKDVVLKLNRSLYGLVDAPMYWYNHLAQELEAVGFQKSDLDPCLFYGHGTVILCYVDDCLFFGPDYAEIYKVIKELQDDRNLSLTVEDDDAYAFLGVDVKPKEGGGYRMTQEGLINKILNPRFQNTCR